MNTIERYHKWLNDFYLLPDEKLELIRLADNNAELEDRFGSCLSFGTAGLRGAMGMGDNRMNRYNVRLASEGCAHWLRDLQLERQGVVIAYDTRNNSRDFADTAACTLAASGIRVRLFNQPTPVPELSFAVRYYRAGAGIVITASHNPACDNGFKLYNNYGSQILPEEASRVSTEIEKLRKKDLAPLPDPAKLREEGLIEIIGDDIDEAFYMAIEKALPSLPPQIKTDIKLVYTPLHGSGYLPVKRVLERSGFTQVLIPESQIVADGNFPTVSSPNPEDKQALSKAIELAQEEAAALVIGTDPDCDRVGVAVLHQGEYRLLSGNQVGVLLLHFLFKLYGDQLPHRALAVKSVVSSSLAEAICRKYQVEMVNTLTGFKYIGALINDLETNGQSDRFIFGFEESCGYLAGDYVRDKDAVAASLLITRMAAYYHEQGYDLIDILNSIYAEYGYYYEHTESVLLCGSSGRLAIKQLMQDLRDHPPSQINNITVTDIKDFYPQTDLIILHLSVESWIAIRPSGTEPKLKLYFSIAATDIDQAKNQSQRLIEWGKQLVDHYQHV